jgi:hypothetical protein
MNTADSQRLLQYIRRVVGARLLGFRAQAVRHLWEAGRLGLGETDADKMHFPANHRLHPHP